MFSAQYKIFSSKKVKQLGLFFQKFWKDAIIFNTCCGTKKIANEWEIICCKLHNLIDLCVEICCCVVIFAQRCSKKFEV